MELNLENILMIVLFITILYYFMINCGSNRVEGIDGSGSTKLRDCCNPGDCATGLRCHNNNWLSGGFPPCKLPPPGTVWYGRCRPKDIIDDIEEWWDGLIT